MYPECRHVRPSGEGCRAAALQGSHWCYFHARMHSRQAERQAERDRLQSIRRETARRQHRQPNGRFATVITLPSHSSPHSSMDARSSQSSHSQTAADAATPPTPTETYDYGAIPVTSASTSEESAVVEASLDLPPIEDTASIQLALIEVLQALAANQIDTKRAGLLLYGLQVASANAKHVNISSHGVRSITQTDDGIPLGPQEYGYDLEDIEEEIRAEDAEKDENDENDTARRHIFAR